MPRQSVLPEIQLTNVRDMFPASPMEESDTVEKNSDPHGARSGGRRNAELPQEFDARGCWRAGRPPDLLPELVNARLERNFPTSAGRRRNGGEMRNFRKNLMFKGAGGPGALQTSPRIGERKTGTEFSDFCWAQAEWRRNAELPQEFDVRGCWRAGRPPDLSPNW